MRLQGALAIGCIWDLVVASPVSLLASPRSAKPRGGGQALCDCWRDPELRSERVNPYVEELTAGFLPSRDVGAELDRVCAPAMTGTGDDISAFAALHALLEGKRKQGSKAKSPFTLEYYQSEADLIYSAIPKPVPQRPRILDYGCGSGAALSLLHRRGSRPEDLHCIEIYDMVPKERKKDFTLHILKDPVHDLRALSAGALKESFHAVSIFAVFHHIKIPEARKEVFASIYAMTRPGANFLISDWDNLGLPKVDVWYDIAHWMLWLFLGAAAPQSDNFLEIGTVYDSVDGYTTSGQRVGFVRDATMSIIPAKVTPLGGFKLVLRRPGGGGEDGGGGWLPDAFGGALRKNSEARGGRAQPAAAEPQGTRADVGLFGDGGETFEDVGSGREAATRPEPSWLS